MMFYQQWIESYGNYKAANVPSGKSQAFCKVFGQNKLCVKFTIFYGSNTICHRHQTILVNCWKEIQLFSFVCIRKKGYIFNL